MSSSQRGHRQLKIYSHMNDNGIFSKTDRTSNKSCRCHFCHQKKKNFFLWRWNFSFWERFKLQWLMANATSIMNKCFLKNSARKKKSLKKICHNFVLMICFGQFSLSVLFFVQCHNHMDFIFFVVFIHKHDKFIGVDYHHINILFAVEYAKQMIRLLWLNNEHKKKKQNNNTTVIKCIQRGWCQKHMSEFL